MTEQQDNNNDNYQSSDELREQAVKFKAMKQVFTKRDLEDGFDEKAVLKKLRTTKDLEKSYKKYIDNVEKSPLGAARFPWESRTRRIVYWLVIRLPQALKWSAVVVFLSLFINYMPGPTQHIVEFIFARALYDTAGISRLPENLETYTHSANIVAADGGIIKSYGKRQVTKKIPDRVKKALLACEDHYLLPSPNNPWYVNAFLIHSGVSWFNLAGAVKDTLRGNTRGASTIIMQNAKKILGNEERTIANKLEEIIIAYMLVSKFGKEQNLDFYINTVPVGSNIYGFSAAAKNYFKKDLEKLNFQQLATIGSFIPNHNRQLALYEIWRGKNFDDLSESFRSHAKSAMAKVNLALGYLRDTGEIDSEQYASWYLSDEESIRRIGFRNFRPPLYGEEEWTSWNVIREVCAKNYTINGRKVSGAQLLLDEKGDVVIETSVNLSLVEKIKEIISQFLKNKEFKKVLRTRNSKTWKRDLQLYKERRLIPPYSNFDEFMEYLHKHINIGVIIMNPQGRIVAYIGGKEFLSGSGADQDDAESQTTKKRKPVIIDLMNQKAKIAPSSTIKPVIAYYSMLVDNNTLQTKFVDKPVEYKYLEREGGKVWLPRNWYPYNARGKGANRYLGRKYSLLESQVLSVNTIFARLYSKPTIRTSMLSGFDKIGLEYNNEDAKYWPFGIGASAVPVQQWLGVYNAFLDGYYRPPSFVKRVLINREVVYDAAVEDEQLAIPLFESKRERDYEMQALGEVCDRGSGATMKKNFKYHKKLVSGKTGTAPNGRTSLFVSHFNPYQDRSNHPDKNMTMMVVFTTNTGGYKSVGASTQGPTKVAGEIYNFMFRKELQGVMDGMIESARRENNHFRNNRLHLANTNKYMDKLLNGSCGNNKIYESIYGVDGYQEALRQILNPNTQIYSGRDELFKLLVDYYCDQNKLVR